MWAVLSAAFFLAAFGFLIWHVAIRVTEKDPSAEKFFGTIGGIVGGIMLGAFCYFFHEGGKSEAQRDWEEGD